MISPRRIFDWAERKLARDDSGATPEEIRALPPDILESTRAYSAKTNNAAT